MKKIPTIFDRNWETDRKVNDKIVVDFDFSDSVATEKLDGMNVRITVRNHLVVRLEKRKNPTKSQKKYGITDPWYVDIDDHDKGDKYLIECCSNTDFSNVEDGEWSAEALGPKIQGNPLNLKERVLFIFSIDSWRNKITFKNVPINSLSRYVTPSEIDVFEKWLPQQRSLFGNDCGIEGIVWHDKQGNMCKIKLSDFNIKV